MWTCSTCGRSFEKINQPHSCRQVAVEQHFKNKEEAKSLFDYLVSQIKQNVGQCSIISLPCCIHLLGKYDFMAVLPKNDGLEMRFALNRILNSSRLKQSIPISKNEYKNCLKVYAEEEIDDEIIGWIKESYYQKGK